LAVLDVSPELTEPGVCPLCGQPLYGWVALADERILDRCESCGVAAERARPIDLAAEWEAVSGASANGIGRIAIPDRASLQAAIGGEGWAAIDRYPGSLLLTKPSLELLAHHNGHRIESASWRSWGPNQPWMWQTLLNGLTFHPNFAREVRGGRLRAANARSRFAFAIDAVVTILGAPLVALLSFPMEAVAALARRGGELRAEARRSL
jgi:hypothetical protein